MGKRQYTYYYFSQKGIRMDTRTFLMRLAFSLLFGLIIGLERQFSRQMAGIRTNMLISLGACLFTLFSFVFTEGDILRIAAQVVTGVGFLGGGVIVRDGFTIKGLTTAATIWCASAVGVAVAGGLIVEAAAATVMVVGTNLILHPISRWVRSARIRMPSRAYEYHVLISCANDNAEHLRIALGQISENSRLQLKSFDQTAAIQKDATRFTMLMQSETEDVREMERLISVILTQPGVLSAAWESVNDQE